MKHQSSVFKSPTVWLFLISCAVVVTVSTLFYSLSLWPFESDHVFFFDGSRAEDILNTLNSKHALGAVIVAGLTCLIFCVRSKYAIILGLLGFAYTTFWGVWLVSDMITGVGINQAVVYHIFSTTEGADYSQFLREIIVASCFLVVAFLILALSVGVGWWGGESFRRLDRGRISARSVLAPLSLGCLLVAIGWLNSPWHSDIRALAQSYSQLDADGERRLEALYNTEPRIVSHNKNLVVLYLESFEATYFNEEIFPGLLPNLRKLREQSAYFTGIEQTPGAGWTIAGIVNTQCGLPLITPGPGINDMGRVPYFLPEAKCLAEYLAENEFHTVYVGGASGKFAGKSRFLEQHGFDIVRDKAYFATRRDAQTREVSGWGVYDDELLDSVYEEFVVLSQRNEPFALFALTMDTHHPVGHMSPSCDGAQYAEGDIQVLNAVHCVDRLVGQFIERIRTSPFYEDTTLVVLSDHLAMSNDAKTLIDTAERRENLLMVFDHAVPAGERQVKGSMMDVGATLLDLLGADKTPLGFGRSLLEPSSDTGGAYSADYYATGDVTDYLSFARSLWDMPSVVGQIKSNGHGGVILGGNLLEAPFFSVLNDRNKVVELHFYNFARRIAELKNGARYIYSLECDQSAEVVGELCLVSGLKGVGERVFSPTEFVNGVRVTDLL